MSSPTLYMRIRIAGWLRRLAEWLSPIYSPEIMGRARQLTAQWEEALGSGFGEAKRHQVYSRLMKEFPLVSKRNISKVIEAAL